MPNCFCLTRKGEKKPTALQKIDDDMRVHFGAPPSKDHWYFGWYDWIGLSLAMGSTFTEIRNRAWKRIGPLEEEDHKALAVLDYLDANYTSDAWAEIGRRA
jgi:hypothetical protein